MKDFLIRWAILTIAAGVMVVLLPGMHAVGDPPILGVAAFSLFMALLNASIKPVVQMLALPFSILTFGILALVIKSGRVSIDGFLWATLGSLIMSIVSGIVSAAFSS